MKSVRGVEKHRGILPSFLNKALHTGSDGKVSGDERPEEGSGRASHLTASPARDDLLATTSHELRNVANMLVGAGELLSETELTSEQRHYVDLLDQGGRSLLALVNDLLDLAQAKAGHLELGRVEFDLRDLVEETLRLIAPRAAELDLVCRIPPGVPTRVVGDPARLRQILVNLAGNAAKFTEHGEIVIAVEGGGPEAAGLYRFTVTDTGPGIPAGLLDGLFEPFAQVKSGLSRGGNGLGLTIAKRLVELMGGSIEVESETGRGASFHFTARLEGAPSSDAGDMPVWKGRRALVVDDSASVRSQLAEVLGVWGVATADAEDAEVALSRLAKAAFDLVLVDARMPRTSGFDLVERMPPELRPRTILMLPIAHRRDDLARLRALGMSGYVMKPLYRVSLRAALAAVLEPGASPTEERGRSVRDAEETPRSRLRILVAEDVSDNRELLRLQLGSLGCEADFVADGAGALERFHAEEHDLVLLDYQMPGLDGRAAAAAMRDFERLSGRRPAVLVEMTGAERRSGEPDVPFDDLLEKPFVKERLRAVLDRVRPRD